MNETTPVEAILLFALLMIAIGGLALLGYRRYRRRMGVELHVVPDRERWVIYRNGSFHRLGGPGRIEIRQWRLDLPSFEEVEYERIAQRIDVRNRARSVDADNLFMHGVPFGFTLTCWYRTDLAAAAKLSKRPLAELAQFEEAERSAQVRLKTRDALIRACQQIQQRYPVGPAASFVAKLVPILPGVDQNEELLALVAVQLAQTLPSVGVVFDAAEPIVLSRIHLSSELVASFARSRTLTILQENLPGANTNDLMQMLSAIEGIDQPRIHRMLIEEQGSGKSIHRDMTIDEEGNFVFATRRAPSDAAERSSVEQGPKEQASTGPAPEATPGAVSAGPTSGDDIFAEDDYQMKPDDWKILKRIPPAA